MHFLKKLRKTRKQQFKSEENIDSQQFKKNISLQKSTEKKQAREKRKRLKLEQKQEQRQRNAILKAQKKIEKQSEKRKRQAEKEEQKLLRKESREAMSLQSKEDKERDKLKFRKEKNEQKNDRKEVKLRLKEKKNQDRIFEKEKKDALILEKKNRKRRIKQIRPYIIKRRRREFIRNVRSINKDSIRKIIPYLIGIIENKSERNLFLKITFNSISFFVMSYLVLYILGELLTLYAAQTFDYNTILFYYKIYFNIDSDQWTPDAVKILYSMKPLVGLVLGVISMIIFSIIRNENSVFKLFYLWFFVHGMVMFFGSLLMGTLLNQGFGWVIAYLYYMDTGKMVFSIIAIFALIVTGASIAKSFLITGNTYFNYVSVHNRKLLLISQVFLPALIGTIIISLMKIPNEYYYTTTEEVIYEILKVSSIVILIIPVLLTFSGLGTIFFDEDSRKVRFHWIYILLSLIIFFGYRFYLTDGLVLIW